jgi:hypothetical protein
MRDPALVPLIILLAFIAAGIAHAWWRRWQGHRQKSRKRSRESSVANRVLNILVPEIVLQRSGVVAIIGELEAASVPQHVGMHGEGHLCGLAEPCHEMMELLSRDGAQTERRLQCHCSEVKYWATTSIGWSLNSRCLIRARLHGRSTFIQVQKYSMMQ